MSGTKTGGALAAQTNKARYGADFYRTIGKKGGKAGRTGGFYQKNPCDCDVISDTHTKPMCAGAKGGLISRRKPRTMGVI